MFETGERAELARKAAGADVSLCSDDEVLSSLMEMVSVLASDEAAFGHLLVEAEQRGLCDREFGLSTASWLAHVTHGSRPALAGRVKTAVHLRRLDVVDDALSDGAISPDHARVLAAAVANPRVAAEVDELQDELVALAKNTPFHAWRRHVSELVELLDQDGGFDPDRDLARNQLRVTSNGGDGVTFTGELVGEHALGFTELLEAETDRWWRRHRNDHDECPDLPVPSRSTLRALALVELITKGAAGRTPTGTGPVVDISLIIHDRDTRPTPGRVPERAVTVDGVVVTGDVLRHLCCDPVVTPVVVNHDTVTLELGRSTRYATAAQRRALIVRDGGCTFPGCDLPGRWCDAHHIVSWEHGGTTDLHNLALLCRHHHAVTHRTGWTMTAHPDQTFTWTTPTGRTLHSQRNRGSPAP